MPSSRLTLVSVKSATRSLYQEVNEPSYRAYSKFSVIAPFLVPSLESNAFRPQSMTHAYSRAERRHLHTQQARVPQCSLLRCALSGSDGSSGSGSNFKPRSNGILRNGQNGQRRRHVSILSSLSDNPGAYKKKIRRGRGASSGKGKTSGRGQKGTKARSKVRPGFEGGQTPIAIVKGKRGFVNHWSPDIVPLNVDRLQQWIDQGRLDTSKPITIKELHESRCLHGVKDGVKLLARNAEELRTPIKIVVSRASQAAIKAIEAAGGTIMTRYYAPSTIRMVLRGLADPISSLMMKDAMKQLDIQSQDGEGEGEGLEASELASASESSPISPASTSTVKPSKLTPPTKSKMPAMMDIKPDLSYISVFKDILSGPGSEPRKFRYRLADPTSRRDFEYYRDHAHRGYLSPMVKEGESPSLYFKVPGSPIQERARAMRLQNAPKKKEERLW